MFFIERLKFSCSLERRIPNFSSPGFTFTGDNFSTDRGGGRLHSVQLLGRVRAGWEWFRHTTFILHFIANLMPLPIWQEVLVQGPGLGGPCARVPGEPKTLPFAWIWPQEILIPWPGKIIQALGFLQALWILKPAVQFQNACFLGFKWDSKTLPGVIS